VIGPAHAELGADGREVVLFDHTPLRYRLSEADAWVNVTEMPNTTNSERYLQEFTQGGVDRYAPKH